MYAVELTGAFGERRVIRFRMDGSALRGRRGYQTALVIGVRMLEAGWVGYRVRRVG